MKKAHLVALVLSILCIVFLNWRKIQVRCVEIFKKDAVFVKYDSKAPNVANITWYAKGKILAMGRQVNGIKQGLEVAYYDNGLIKSKTLFINGVPSGKGFLYARNGKLLYSGTYRNGGRYGDWYSYYYNGQIKEYLLYDIHKHIAFRLPYDNKGKINSMSMSGLVVSPYFYTIDTVSKSIITMGDENDSKKNFSNISDLYIIVTHAPKTKLTVKVWINSVLYTFGDLKTGTLKIPQAFNKKGTYRFYVESHLYDVDGKNFNGMNIQYSIEKSTEST